MAEMTINTQIFNKEPVLEQEVALKWIWNHLSEAKMLTFWNMIQFWLE